MPKQRRLQLLAAKQQRPASQMRRTGEHRMVKQVGMQGTEAGMAGTAATETGQSRATESVIETGCPAGLTGESGSLSSCGHSLQQSEKTFQGMQGQKFGVLLHTRYISCLQLVQVACSKSDQPRKHFQPSCLLHVPNVSASGGLQRMLQPASFWPSSTLYHGGGCAALIMLLAVHDCAWSSWKKGSAGPHVHIASLICSKRHAENCQRYNYSKQYDGGCTQTCTTCCLGNSTLCRDAPAVLPLRNLA